MLQPFFEKLVNIQIREKCLIQFFFYIEISKIIVNCMFSYNILEEFLLPLLGRVQLKF